MYSQVRCRLEALARHPHLFGHGSFVGFTQRRVVVHIGWDEVLSCRPGVAVLPKLDKIPSQGHLWPVGAPLRTRTSLTPTSLIPSVALPSGEWWGSMPLLCPQATVLATHKWFDFLARSFHLT